MNLPSPDSATQRRAGRNPVAALGWLAVLVGFSSACPAQVFYSVHSPEGGHNWLLGTIHSEDERVLDLSPVLEQALEQADTVALELVPDQATLDRLARAMRLPEDQRLSERLDSCLYRRVAGALRERGIEADAIDRLRPWAAAMALAQPPVESGRFMDMALAEHARQHGAATVGLETVEEQLAFFTGLDHDVHLRLLENSVAADEHRAERLEALMQAYLDGDIERLVDLAERQMAQLSEPVRSRFRREGIVERNREMARRAQPLLDRGRTLIAVGALHLPGEEGLIALLREQGNRVEAIY